MANRYPELHTRDMVSLTASGYLRFFFRGPRGAKGAVASTLNPTRRRCSMTVQQAVQLFRQIQETRVRLNTVKSYAPLLKKFTQLRIQGA